MPWVQIPTDPFKKVLPIGVNGEHGIMVSSLAPDQRMGVRFLLFSSSNGLIFKLNHHALVVQSVARNLAKVEIWVRIPASAIVLKCYYYNIINSYP